MNKLSTRAYRSKPVRPTVQFSDNIVQSTGNIRVNPRECGIKAELAGNKMKFFPHKR